MKTIKAKTTYRTDDGREFTDQKQAERHDRLVKAKREYESAKRTLGKLMAESCLTADGQPFKIGLWPDYYWITPGYFSMPSLLKVSFWGTNWDWEESSDEATTVVLLSDLSDSGQQLGHIRRFPINELYANKDRAQAALIEAQRKWLREMVAEVKKAAKAVGGEA
jgi:hypothetical protein